MRESWWRHCVSVWKETGGVECCTADCRKRVVLGIYFYIYDGIYCSGFLYQDCPGKFQRPPRFLQSDFHLFLLAIFYSPENQKKFSFSLQMAEEQDGDNTGSVGLLLRRMGLSMSIAGLSPGGINQ